MVALIRRQPPGDGHGLVASLDRLCRAADDISMSEAFDRMRSRARSGGRRLVDVASEVLSRLEGRG